MVDSCGGTSPVSEPAPPATQVQAEAEFAELEVDAPRVGIIMGSKSDMDEMEKAGKVLAEHDVRYEIRVMSAHRDPEMVADYCRNAKMRGLRVIIAGAGLSAALPGVAAAHTEPPGGGGWRRPPPSCGSSGSRSRAGSAPPAASTRSCRSSRCRPVCRSPPSG